MVKVFLLFAAVIASAALAQDPAPPAQKPAPPAESAPPAQDPAPPAGTTDPYKEAEALAASNPVKACELFKTSAELGNPEGMLRLGDCYMAVPGYPRDPLTALTWYESASDKGVPRAQRAFVTGSLLTTQQPSEPAKAKARRVLEEMLRRNPNDAHVLFILGVDQYARRAYDVSIDTLKQSSELGSLQATTLLGCLARSCREQACRVVKPETFYEDRYLKTAGRISASAPSYRTMATQLRKQLLIGEVCSGVAAG